MLSQKLTRRKSALMLEDVTWFASLLTTRKIQNNVEKTQKSIVEKCSQNLFIAPVMRFQKRLKRSTNSQNSAHLFWQQVFLLFVFYYLWHIIC